MKSILAFLKIFVPLFVLFAAIGAIAGFAARENVIVEKLVAESQLLEIDGQYYLQQNCAESGLEFLYSIDSNNAEFNGSTMARLTQARQQLELPPARYNEYRTLLGSFLGGTTGGFQLRSALKKPPGGWSRTAVRKTIVGIIASVTGYNTGRYLSSHYDTDCSSQLVATTLNNASLMIAVERARLKLNLKFLQNLPGAELSLTGRAIEQRERDPAFMCSAQLADMGDRLASALEMSDLDPDSSHFALIDAIAQLHVRIVKSEDYPDLLAGQLFKHQPQLQAFEAGSGAIGELRANRIENWDRACEQAGYVAALQSSF